MSRTRAERWALQASDGVRLSALRWRGPSGVSLSLLVLPGYWRRAASPRMSIVCRRLARGAEVWALDFRGHGRSSGRYTFGLEEVEDLAALLDLAAREGTARIGLVGFSMGGWIASVLLGADPRRFPSVGGLAVVSSPDEFAAIRPRAGWDLPRQLVLRDCIRPPRIRRASLRTPRPRASERLARVTLPVAVFHHRRDWLIGFEHGNALYRAAGGSRCLFAFDGGGRYHADALPRFLPGPFFGALESWLGHVFPEWVGPSQGSDDEHLRPT